MIRSASDATRITRASKSNLALAFIALPRERRHDISVFYAFCRVVDDIADDETAPLNERRLSLDLWRQSLERAVAGEPPLAEEVRALIARHQLPIEHFREIIAGMEMDLDGARYETFEELSLYCYRVAGVVGLVSVQIFGCPVEPCREYALALGTAFQLTNILRDVGHDYAKGGRVYVPRVDLEHFGYTVGQLATGEPNRAFHELMHFEAARAHEFYRAAEKSLPVQWKRELVAAEIMHSIYRPLLKRMERDGFPVFGRRYGLSRLQKMACILKVLIRLRTKP